jgi:hypothetical protein
MISSGSGQKLLYAVFGDGKEFSLETFSEIEGYLAALW